MSLVARVILLELLRVRLAAGLEHGRVYENDGGVTISDPECYVTVGVMFWFGYQGSFLYTRCA